MDLQRNSSFIPNIQQHFGGIIPPTFPRSVLSFELSTTLPTSASRQDVTYFHQYVTGDKLLISLLVLESHCSHTHIVNQYSGNKGEKESPLAETTKLGKAREAQRHKTSNGTCSSFALSAAPDVYMALLLGQTEGVE